MQMSARLGHEDELVGVYEASDLRARTMDELERQLEEARGCLGSP